MVMSEPSHPRPPLTGNESNRSSLTAWKIYHRQFHVESAEDKGLSPSLSSSFMSLFKAVHQGPTCNSIPFGKGSTKGWNMIFSKM